MKLHISWDDSTIESEIEWKDLREGPGADIIGEVVFDYETNKDLTIDCGGDDAVFELDVADHDYDDDDELELVLNALLETLEEKLTTAGLRA